MIKLTIPFIENKKAVELEQAAGFPPFTRGYSCTIKNTQLINHCITEYIINDYSDVEIISLFKKIASLKIKDPLKLTVRLSGKAEDVIYIRILRTLLSFTNQKLHDNPNVIQFEFYADAQYVTNELDVLILSKAAQIDYLLVDDLKKWQPFKLLVPNVPVDSLYGSKHIEKETENIFFRLWSKIEESLT